MREDKKMEEKSEQKEIKTPQKSHWKAALIKLLVLAALVAAGYGLWKNPQIIDQIKNAVNVRQEETTVAPLPGADDRIMQLQQQVQALQAEVSRLGSLPQTAAAEPDLTAVNEKIAAIEKTNLNVIDSKADVATVLGLITRMDKAEAELAKLAKVTDEGALTLTAAMLVKDSAERGGSFEYEMEVLNQIALHNAQLKQPLEQMARYARSGIVPSELLEIEFAKIYARLVKEQKDAFDQTWTDRINSKLSEIVQIKRVNQEAPAFEANQGLEKVRQDVLHGNLEAAVNELQLPENADFLKDKALAAWLEKARGTVEFNQAVSKIAAGSLAMMKVNFLKKSSN